MSTNEGADTEVLRMQVAQLTGQIQLLAAQLQSRPLAASPDVGGERKPWWTTLVGFLGLPAAVVAILLQFNQANTQALEPARVQADTRKALAEEAKLRLEAQVLINDLADKNSKDITVVRAELDRVLPQLQATLSRLYELRTETEKMGAFRILLQFVLLYLVFIGIGLFFEIVGQAWVFLLNATSNTLYAREWPTGEGLDVERRRKRHERIRNLVPWLHSVLGPVPSILEWGLRVAVFVTLIIPLFDAVVIALGSTLTFQEVLQKAIQMEIGQAISILREAMYGTGS